MDAVAFVAAATALGGSVLLRRRDGGRLTGKPSSQLVTPGSPLPVLSPPSGEGDTSFVEIPTLWTCFPSQSATPSPLLARTWPKNLNFVGPTNDVVWNTTVAGSAGGEVCRPPTGRAFRRAGPREQLFWRPDDVHAAILTCGGLCPGLNVVIRELVMALHFAYGVKRISGIRQGYRGLYAPDGPTGPVELTPRTVASIHTQGGTMLGSSRGGFDRDKIMAAIRRRGFTHIFAIGGDGTMRGALAIHEAVAQAGLKCCVCAVPKTIDNDVALLDRSFGFSTAVAQAARVITCAHTEAKAATRGVGLVKVMGRHAGFIAMHSALASRDVNACVIPEMHFHLPTFLRWLHERLEARRHAVVVVAEGVQLEEQRRGVDPKQLGRFCAERLAAEIAGEAVGAAAGCDTSSLPGHAEAGGGADESGNRRLLDVGEFLKAALMSFMEHIVDLRGLEGSAGTVKLLDPTYMVRAVCAIPDDALLCSSLAFDAVHGCMAGYSGFTVGQVDRHDVMIPLPMIVQLKSRRVDPDSVLFSRLCASTGQPDFGGPHAAAAGAAAGAGPE